MTVAPACRIVTFATIVTLSVTGRLWAADAAELNAAMESITVGELRNHVAALADDTFEGREAGTRGGRAAGLYVVKQLQRLGLPGGVNGSYYQPFGEYSNIVAALEGSDPELKQQYIVIGAHYDHVGYGSRRNSYGPIGFIHNGADDNASGVSGMLEVAEAFTMLGIRPKRSILFCFWDGEEKGLYGSKHWVEHPTVSLDKVALYFNADMIGRLRGKKLEIFGGRSAAGLRRLVSLANDDPNLSLFFNWELKENSDHYSFYSHKVPVLMFFTGLHEDYHRPSDDVEKLDIDGMQQTARLAFRTLEHAADAPQIAGYRAQSRLEGPWLDQATGLPLPPLPGRLGVTWDEKQAAEGRIVVVRVAPGSAAQKAGLKPGDRIAEFAGQPVTAAEEFRKLVLAAKNPVATVIERTGETEPLKPTIELAGTPVRLGISWRLDDGEPGTLIVNRVVPGSPAAVAGVKVNDRIYAAGSQESLTTESFQSQVATTAGPLELLVETLGQPRRLTVNLTPVTQ